jgi:hypothetical protein
MNSWSDQVAILTSSYWPTSIVDIQCRSTHAHTHTRAHTHTQCRVRKPGQTRLSCHAYTQRKTPNKARTDRRSRPCTRSSTCLTAKFREKEGASTMQTVCVTLNHRSPQPGYVDARRPTFGHLWRCYTNNKSFHPVWISNIAVQYRVHKDRGQQNKFPSRKPTASAFQSRQRRQSNQM